MDYIEDAKGMLWNYFDLIASASGIHLNRKQYQDIVGIVDNIREGILDELEEE